ncbi:MAG TPA: ABC transporter ATP-binding protein [Elusimicrobiota bacterium]|jgi:manganese/zinc/iron transport system ATP- binding protein|nr:ABC transporter ATP-binding protein [Elusimicrobiota bacterium]
MPAELLHAKGLSVGYGAHAVLHGINFSIERGDFMGVMGPNGAGKTTLLKTFLGLLKPLAGKIELTGAGGGRPLFGYVPQRESLDLHYPLTSLEVALMGRFGRIGILRRPGAADLRIARACLRQTHMDAYADKPYRKLSGGQKQRVLISRALASEPEILLLDEPTNGMDINSEKAIMELLTELQKEKGTTVVFVTHLMSTIERYARRVALITFQGKLLVGAKSEMLAPEVLAEAYKSR